MIYYGNELYHHGIKGQRRYQNEDGSLTPEGREHYGYGKIKIKSSGYDDATIDDATIDGEKNRNSHNFRWKKAIRNFQKIS